MYVTSPFAALTAAPMPRSWLVRAQQRTQRSAALARVRRARHVAEHGAHRSDPVEPRTLGKIIAAGQRRDRRRHQSRPHADMLARHQSRPLLAAQRQPYARGQIGARMRAHDKPHLSARRQGLDAFDR